MTRRKPDGLIPYGYCVVLRSRERGLFPAACPPGYFSISGCLCRGVIPDWECISDSDTSAFAEKWSIGREAAEALFRFNSEHAADINFMFLTYPDLDLARSVKSRFFADRDDVLLIGIGGTEPGVLQNPDIRRTSPFPEDGALLGFDVYAYCGDEAVDESGGCGTPDFVNGKWSGFGCSVWCVDSEEKIRKRLGLTLNQFGFYGTLEEATRVADLINDEKLGEPVAYFPLALIRCDA